MWLEAWEANSVGDCWKAAGLIAGDAMRWNCDEPMNDLAAAATNQGCLYAGSAGLAKALAVVWIAQRIRPLKRFRK